MHHQIRHAHSNSIRGREVTRHSDPSLRFERRTLEPLWRQVSLGGDQTQTNSAANSKTLLVGSGLPTTQTPTGAPTKTASFASPSLTDASSSTPSASDLSSSTDAGAAPSSSSAATPNASVGQFISDHIGPVVGVLAGIVAVIAILLVIIILLVKRSRRKKAAAELARQSIVALNHTPSMALSQKPQKRVDTFDSSYSSTFKNAGLFESSDTPPMTDAAAPLQSKNSASKRLSAFVLSRKVSTNGQQPKKKGSRDWNGLGSQDDGETTLADSPSNPQAHFVIGGPIISGDKDEMTYPPPAQTRDPRSPYGLSSSSGAADSRFLTAPPSPGQRVPSPSTSAATHLASSGHGAENRLHEGTNGQFSLMGAFTKATSAEGDDGDNSSYGGASPLDGPRHPAATLTKGRQIYPPHLDPASDEHPYVAASTSTGSIQPNHAAAVKPPIDPSDAPFLSFTPSSVSQSEFNAPQPRQPSQSEPSYFSLNPQALQQTPQPAASSHVHAFSHQQSSSLAPPVFQQLRNAGNSGPPSPAFSISSEYSVAGGAPFEPAFASSHSSRLPPANAPSPTMTPYPSSSLLHNSSSEGGAPSGFAPAPTSPLSSPGVAKETKQEEKQRAAAMDNLIAALELGDEGSSTGANVNPSVWRAAVGSGSGGGR